MESKKTIKVSLGIITCIIIIFLLIITMILMYYHYNNRNVHVSEKNETNTSEITDIPQIKKVNKLDESKEIIYSSYSTYSSEYSYSIPYININSEEINKINKEIETYYKPLIEEEIKNMDEGLSISMSIVKYNSYINNNILSLVVSNLYPNDCIYYKVYNLDIYTGKVLTNSDLISLKNMNETKFLDTLKELYKNEFVNTYGSKETFVNNLKNSSVGFTEFELQEQENFYEEQLNKTISTNNYSMQTPIFLNENGKLCVIAPIYSIAGADLYYHIIDTNI